MGQFDSVPPEFWRELGYDPARQQQLQEHIVNSQRRGHGWHWITQQQLIAAGESLVTKDRSK